jgi:lysyl-tRNA synthetase class 2
VNTLVEYRASFFKKVRNFFDERGSLEVDPPALSTYAPIDSFIDPYQTTNGKFLHTSPEYAMKRLLVSYAKDIYFLGHVFRKEEFGSRHNSEFTMCEWYKTNTNETEFLNEVLSFISLFLGDLPYEILSYDEAFFAYAKRTDIDTKGWSEEERRHYIWATFVEPNFGKDKITVITNFPKEDAALSKTQIVNGKEVAKRYEFFYRGIELGNGFYELEDPEEQMNRFEEANKKRQASGKDTLPVDTYFLDALKKGLPKETFGVACGFDRLLMLSAKKTNLKDILLFNDETI